MVEVGHTGVLAMAFSQRASPPCQWNCSSAIPHGVAQWCKAARLLLDKDGAAGIYSGVAGYEGNQGWEGHG